jgi:hypothetical protein
MAAPIPELSVVRLTHSFEHKARKLPEGSVGTVVHAGVMASITRLNLRGRFLAW